MADEHRSAPWLEVSLIERQRLADAKTRAPEHDNEPADAQARRPLAGLAHYGDNLLDPEKVSGILAALVAGVRGQSGSRGAWLASAGDRSVKLNSGVHGLLLESLG
jgi:ribulose 1,5-bisphosphate carboxylase large subunit-like protein